MRIFPAVAATGLTLLASGWAHAVGLGNVTAQSAIGEPLKIEIALIGSGSTEISCVRLSPGQGTDLPWIRQARIALAGPVGNRRIVISTSQPIYEPIVMLGVELNCEGILRREYPLLLPSSGIVTQPVAASAAGKDSAALPRERPALPSGQTDITVGPSLYQLARQLYPDDRAQRRRFVAAARQAHPDQFPDRSSLSRPIPREDALDLAALRREAERPARPPTSSRATISRPAEPKSSARPEQALREEAAPPTAPAPPQPSAQGDRLTVGGDMPPPELKLSFALSDPSLVGRTSDDERERMRQEQRLLLVLDEKLIAQLEIASKIRELEQYQRHLTSEADRLGINAPQTGPSVPALDEKAPSADVRRPSPIAPQKPAEPAADSTDWWQFIFSIGGFALLAGLLALHLKRRRLAKEKAEAEFFNSPDTGDSASEGSSDGTTSSAATPGLESRHEGLSGPQSSVDFAQLDWEPPNSLMPTDSVAPLPLEEEDLAGEHDSAVELAEIMMSFGRVQGAAQTLADFIRGNPKQAVVPWLKLLEVYKTADMRSEFDGLTRQLNRTFNVKIVEWDDFDMEKASAETIERMPHIVSELERLWGTVDCQAYLHKLLRDNRDGTRQGFPLAVIDDILCLLGILNQHLGPYRETTPEHDDTTAG